jgi:hypothetical protein
LRVASALPGCRLFQHRPATVTRDRFDYVASISDSWKRQMLQNLLKVRYADAPVFLNVTSVISAYSIAGQAEAAAQYSPPGRRRRVAEVARLLLNTRGSRSVPRTPGNPGLRRSAGLEALGRYRAELCR